MRREVSWSTLLLRTAIWILLAIAFLGSATWFLHEFFGEAGNTRHDAAAEKRADQPTFVVSIYRKAIEKNELPPGNKETPEHAPGLEQPSPIDELGQFGPVTYDGETVAISLSSAAKRDFLLLLGYEHGRPLSDGETAKRPVCTFHNSKTPKAGREIEPKLGTRIAAPVGPSHITPDPPRDNKPPAAPGESEPKDAPQEDAPLTHQPYSVEISAEDVDNKSRLSCAAEAFALSYSRRMFRLGYDRDNVFNSSFSNPKWEPRPTRMELMLDHSDDIRIQDLEGQVVNRFSDLMEGRREYTIAWTDIHLSEKRDLSLIWIGVLLGFAVGCAIEAAKPYIELLGAKEKQGDENSNAERA